MVHAGRGALAALAVSALGFAAAGCATSSFQAQEDVALRHIARAEGSGVGEELDQARDLIDAAREAEGRAQDELDEAQEDLVEAQRDVADGDGRVTAREDRLSRTERELAAAEADLSPIEAELQAMLARPMTQAEAESILGSRLALARQRVTNLRLARAAHELELKLARLELRSARAREEAAETQRRAAVERLQLAGTLFDLASSRAETLELERLTGQQRFVRERLGQMRP